MLGIDMIGYYIPRYAKGFLDDLEASALALSAGEETVLLISVDTCLILTDMCNRFLKQIEVATGVSSDRISLSASHTHTGPLLEPTDMFEADETIIKIYSTSLASGWQTYRSLRWRICKMPRWVLRRVGHRNVWPTSAAIR